MRRPRALPDQLFFKIGEVADIVGVKPHVLRYWEAEFRQLRPMKTRGSHRIYRRTDVEVAMIIRRLLHDEGFTVPGARKKLKELRGDAAPESAETPSLATLVDSKAPASAPPPVGIIPRASSEPPAAAVVASTTAAPQALPSPVAAQRAAMVERATREEPRATRESAPPTSPVRPIAAGARREAQLRAELLRLRADLEACLGELDRLAAAEAAAQPKSARVERVVLAPATVSSR